MLSKSFLMNDFLELFLRIFEKINAQPEEHIEQFLVTKQILVSKN